VWAFSKAITVKLRFESFIRLNFVGKKMLVTRFVNYRKNIQWLAFVHLEQKVNPGTDCFVRVFFPLKFAIKSILILVLLHLWEMFLLTIWSVLSGDNFLNNVFVFAQETWFQWFWKADCLCRKSDQLICGVCTNIGSFCWKFYFCVCDAHKCWIVSGFAIKTELWLSVKVYWFGFWWIPQLLQEKLVFILCDSNFWVRSRDGLVELLLWLFVIASCIWDVLYQETVTYDR